MLDYETQLVELLSKMVRDIVQDELAKAASPSPEHVTVAEYARRHSIGESTVRRAIAEQRLDVERVGRAVRVRADDRIGPRNPTECELITLRAQARLLGRPLPARRSAKGPPKAK